MSGDRLDELSKALARAGSRRMALKALVGVAFGGLLSLRFGTRAEAGDCGGSGQQCCVEGDACSCSGSLTVNLCLNLGSICCPAGQSCVSAGSFGPQPGVCCDTGQICRIPGQLLGVCCPSGLRCVDGACCPLGGLVCGAPPNAHCCPPESQCVNGACCRRTQVCVGTDGAKICCAPPMVCNTSVTGEVGGCGCPPNSTVCGSTCCPPGHLCTVSKRCIPAPKPVTPCGEPGITCCPGDEPCNPEFGPFACDKTTNTCVPCGGSGQICCPGSIGPCASGATCQHGLCPPT